MNSNSNSGFAFKLFSISYLKMFAWNIRYKNIMSWKLTYESHTMVEWFKAPNFLQSDIGTVPGPKKQNVDSIHYTRKLHIYYSFSFKI